MFPLSFVPHQYDKTRIAFPLLEFYSRRSPIQENTLHISQFLSIFFAM
jgi:hypothetical protein